MQDTKSQKKSLVFLYIKFGKCVAYFPVFTGKKKRMNNLKGKLSKHSTKRNKIHTNTLKQGDERFIHWKLQNMAEENQETNKWKDILCSQTGWLIIVKITTLPNVVYRLQAILIKITTIFAEIEKLFLNVKGYCVAKTILKTY